MASTKPQYWLLKTEPETYSFEQLKKDGKTPWNGVRNFQARNYLKKMSPGDLALIYHSGDHKAVVGVSEIISSPYPEIDPEDGKEWVQVDLAPRKAFQSDVPLSQIKASATLLDLPLIKQSRLSVMPITAQHYKTLVKLGGIQP